MVHPMPMKLVGDNFSRIPLAIGVFISILTVIALCAKQARRYSTKYGENDHRENVSGITPRSPLPSPKQLITTIGSKAMPSFIHQEKKNGGGDQELGRAGDQEAGFGEGGLWQKSILMGEKCQPLNFSGAIYYDSCGKRVPELPRSPRTTPLPTLISFHAG